MVNFKNEKFDIIIQAGQSNAEGSGIGPVGKAYMPNENVYYLNSVKTVDTLDDGLKIEYMDEPFQLEIAKERLGENGIIGDFSLSFAENYMRNGLLVKGRKLLIVRAAIGGTGFYKGHWGLKDILYLKMLEMVDFALSLNVENRIVAFLWHQGEHDAWERNPVNVYYEQLTNMLNDVRTRYGCVPFITGDFVSEWKTQNIGICEPIIRTIQEVVEKNDKCAFVQTADLLSNNQKTGNGDNIHFCRESLYILGERYFREFTRLIK